MSYWKKFQVMDSTGYSFEYFHNLSRVAGD
jgi:hypothetical protein